MHALDSLAGEVRAALSWATAQGRAADGLALVSGLDPWWRELGRADEARPGLDLHASLEEDTASQGPRCRDAQRRLG